MPKFRIPMRWEMYAVVEVEADDLDSAVEDAREGNLPVNDADYVEGTFTIDYEMIEDCNDPKLLELTKED